MIKLQEGQFVRLIGMEVKGENDIYIVEHDYTKPDPRYSVVRNEYCLRKVKLNGEKKTSGYTIVFYDEYKEKKNPNMDIKIITDLKAGKKEVNTYLKNRNNDEIVITFEKSAHQEVKDGSIIKFSEGIKFGVFGNYYVSNRGLWKVNFRNEGKNITITELGKKGQVLSNSRIYGADERLTKLFLSKMIVMDKIEAKKGDIEKEVKAVAVENKEDIKEVAVENNTNNTDNTKEVESKTNTTINCDDIDCKVVFNEDKNGIELHFNNKPDVDIRSKIKSIGFKWSRFNKVWYIKDSKEVRTQLQELGLLNNNNTNMENNNAIENLNNIEVANIELTEINDINFNIDKTISDRENDGHWTFRTEKRDHQKEILNYLENYKKDYLNTIEPLKNKTTKNYYNKWFNSYINRYYNNYYNRLKNNASNPSWLVTGRSGRNTNKDRKYQSRYDNLIKELTSLEEEFKSKINKIKSAVKKEKVSKIKAELNTDSLDVKLLDAVLVKQKININSQAVDNIFNNTNTNVNCYNYKNKYYMIKNWGYWRLYNNKGNEITILGRCHKSLIECKKSLLYVLTHNKEVA